MSISNEAVEAAAKALRKKFNGYEVERPWDSRDQQTTYRNDATAALEAAAPHMLDQSAIDQIRRESYEAGRDQALAGVTPIYDAAIADAWEEGVSYALPGTKSGLKAFAEMRSANPYRPTP